MKLTALLVAGALTCTSTLSFAQSSGGGGSSGAGSSSGDRLWQHGCGIESSNGTVNGTGGSPGPNTSNALDTAQQEIGLAAQVLRRTPLRQRQAAM